MEEHSQTVSKEIINGWVNKLQNTPTIKGSGPEDVPRHMIDTMVGVLVGAAELQTYMPDFKTVPGFPDLPLTPKNSRLAVSSVVDRIKQMQRERSNPEYTRLTNEAMKEVWNNANEQRRSLAFGENWSPFGKDSSENK